MFEDPAVKLLIENASHIYDSTNISSYFKMKRFLLSLLATLSLPTLVSANSMVEEALINADKLFKLGSDGCIMVKMAIKVSTTPKAFGEVSDTLKDEIKRYAIRCNLSY